MFLCFNEFMLSYDILNKILVKKRKISKKTLLATIEESQKTKKDPGDILVEKKLITKDDLLKVYAEHLGVSFIDLSKTIIRKDLLFKVPEKVARESKIIVFDEKDNVLCLAMVDPEDLETVDTVKKKTGEEIKVFLTTESSLEKAQAQYHQGLKVEFTKILEESLATSQALRDSSLEDVAERLPIIKVVDTLLKYAVIQEASDIHIEPRGKNAVVRFRVDGILQDVIVIAKEVLPAIVARIKILANLKIDEHRLPQDGRFRIDEEDSRISCRVSIMPVMGGEKVVMRLLNEATQNFTLEQLGFLHSVILTVKKNIEKPHGMILITGPTGCGKTTTLYSFLNLLNIPDVNIATIEDPIEYQLAGINQSQVKPKIGYTFATGLRSIVRQDPDIIMVGEIRDFETAEMAIQSALTGHLVLSTLHTNDAAGAATRLIEMGVKPFLAASTINIIIAQRLVRRICPNCIEKYKLNESEIKQLRKDYNIDAVLDIAARERVFSERKKIEDIYFYRGRGCSACNQRGYKGRMGIFEVLEATKKINDLIVAETPSEKINEAAISEGMITLAQEGLIKAMTGVTTLEEVIRETTESNK